jgi:hypothetical protein
VLYLQDREDLVDFILNKSIQPVQDLDEAPAAAAPPCDEVRLDLNWLRSSPATGSSPAVLRAMLQLADTDRRWLRHPAAATFSALLWRQLSRYFYANFSAHLLFCVIISLLVIFDQAHHTTLQALSETPLPEVTDTGGSEATNVNNSVIPTASVHHNTGEWVLLAISLVMAMPLGLHTMASMAAWAVRCYKTVGRGRQERPELPGKK